MAETTKDYVGKEAEMSELTLESMKEFIIETGKQSRGILKEEWVHSQLEQFEIDSMDLMIF